MSKDCQNSNLQRAAKRSLGSVVWLGKQWEYSHLLIETNQEQPHCIQPDERTSPFYEALGVIVDMMGRAVGMVNVCLESRKDSAGAWLNGGKRYTLHIPKDPPVSQSWSVTIYDNQTRCLIDTGIYPDRSSRDDIMKSADGSVDLYFGPIPPIDKPLNNWIKTALGKGWFANFRFYAPTRPCFDESWVLPDFEELK